MNLFILKRDEQLLETLRVKHLPCITRPITIKPDMELNKIFINILSFKQESIKLLCKVILNHI